MYCKICNIDTKNAIFSKHLKNKHNLDVKSYYDLYCKTENEGHCVVCNKETPFINIKVGYKKHCCGSCAQKDPNTRAKIRKTNLERYGYANGNRDKCKETCLQKYGTTSYLATKQCRLELKEKNQELYGTNTPFESKIIQDKVKETNLKNLGVEYPLSNKNIHDKAQTNKYLDIYNYAEENNMSLLIDLTNLYGWGWLYELDIPYIVYKHVALVSNMYLDSIKDYNKTHPIIPKIAKYNKYNAGGKCKSKAEYKILEYIKSIYSGMIIENSRKIIDNYELDLYLPELKLAIEYNGIYWHSIKHKQKSYHYNKSIACKNKDIRLLHIYEYENFEDIKHQISSIINNTETIDINKNCNFDKDNWKLYEQQGILVEYTGPIKLLDYPELWGAGEIIYKPL